MDIYKYLEENKVVCPYPQAWQAIYNQIIKEAGFEDTKLNWKEWSELGIPNPLVLGRWLSSDNEKKVVFHAQIEFAKKHDVIHIIENWIDEYDMDIFFTGNHFVEPDTSLVGDIGDSYN